MAFIEDKVVPRREDRLNASNAYGGKLCDLIGDSRGGCLVNKERSFSQTCNCQMGLSLAMVLTIPDSVIIMHGPVGCGSSSHNDTYFRNRLKDRDGKSKPLIWVSTDLAESDIISGGEKKLEEAIIKSDSIHRPSAIIVVTSCAPGIIGDDVEEVVAQVQKQVAAKVILVNCEGFKTKISATAYDAVYLGIAKGLELSYDEEKKVVENQLDLIQEEYEKSRTVNVFNVFSIGLTDELELKRLLNALGLKVNFYPNFVHPEDFRELSKAALNVSICPTHDDYFLKLLKEKYGIPYIIKNMPIGIENTNQWIVDIAREFNLEKEAEKLIESEVTELEKSLEFYRSKLKGKKIFVSGGEIRVAVTALLMKELGCELVGIRGHHYDQFGDDIFEKLVSDNPDIEVNIATTQVFELVNMLNRTKPDLFLGHSGSNIWSSKLGIPSLPIFSLAQYYLGYKGAFEVARRSVKVLENTAFQRNLRDNLKLPYKKDWYEKSPFAYITEQG